MVVCGGVRNVIAWQIRSYIDCNDIVILRVLYSPLLESCLYRLLLMFSLYILSLLLFGWGGDWLYHSILSPSPPPFPCYLYHTPSLSRAFSRYFC